MFEQVRNRTRRLMGNWFVSTALLVLVVFSFRSAIADWNDVPTGSMKPTILIGDRIFVNKLAYDLKLPFTECPAGHLVGAGAGRHRHLLVAGRRSPPGQAGRGRAGRHHRDEEQPGLAQRAAAQLRRHPGRAPCRSPGRRGRTARSSTARICPGIPTWWP